MTQYEIKSKNLIDGILQLVGALVQTNSEIEKQIEVNKQTAENCRQSIEQLGIDNENLAKVKTNNEAFVTEITELIERFKSQTE